jgi:carbonic anhydrase/acetyltransferase-like protein (isoleucine patch superfamily)
MTIRDFEQFRPDIAAGVYVDETAVVIGNVSIGADSSVWPMAVVRGDVNRISIGSRTNIQDGCVLHVTHSHEGRPGGYPLSIGNNVTVGHKVMLHGCNVHSSCLIGMGATIMDGAEVQSHVLVGAGSLVPQNKQLESGYLWLGSPVTKIRALSQQELDWIDYAAEHYVELKNKYL